MNTTAFTDRSSGPRLPGALRRRGVPGFSALAAVALLVAQVAASPAAYAHEKRPGDARLEGASAHAGGPPAGGWKDPNGSPLPIQTDEEIIEFMQTAEIESVADLDVGITNPRRVVMVKNGVRMRAALRDFDQQYENVRFNHQFFWQIRDSYVFDIAAYELAKMLDLNNVPPVTLRRVNGVGASLQIWLEGALVEFDRVEQKIAPPEAENMSFLKQYQMVRIFDTLIGNIDRNNGNILFDEHWNFWLIDHSRSFVPDDTSVPYLKAIDWCERTLFEKLKSLDRDELLARLTPPLQPADIGWILKRRDKIVARIEGLIVERGEAAVLFDGFRGVP